MATYTRSTTDRIRFSDGREGRQTVHHYDDGTNELAEVVVTRTAKGERCRQVYARRPDLMARVYSLTDLAPATWEIAK